MNKIFKTLTFGQIIMALVIGIGAEQTAQGREPYLQLIGPPPLRFEMSAPNTPTIIAELALPKPPPEKQPDEDETNSVPDKKETAAATTPTPAIPMPKPNPNNTGTVIDTAAGAPPPPVDPASYMLNMIPQMINQYFTPIPGGGAVLGPNGYQPGDSVLVPAELGFVPPMPLPQSRSVYKSQ